MIATWDYIRLHVPHIANQIARDYAESDDDAIKEELGLPYDAKVGLDEALDFLDRLNDLNGLMFEVDLPEDEDTDGAQLTDVNNDGDADVAEVDTSGDGEPDVAVVDADSKEEEKEAVKAAEEKLSDKSDYITSTGKTKDELSESEAKGGTVSDEDEKELHAKRGPHGDDCEAGFTRDKRVDRMKRHWGPTDTQKKNGTVSDEQQKNVLRALIDHRF